MLKSMGYALAARFVGYRFSVMVLGVGILLVAHLAYAGQPVPDEVFAMLGMTEKQIGLLAEGKPIAYALEEGGDNELATATAQYLREPAAKVAARLRQDDPDTMDVEVNAHGHLSTSAGVGQLERLHLPRDEAKALLDYEPGEEFNLSAHEIECFKSLKAMQPKRALGEVERCYRELIYHRFEAYHHGGTAALAGYVREDTQESSPGQELRLAAGENRLVEHYLPDLYQAWLDYPHKALPKGAEESFLWVNKTVENRPAVILRHRAGTDWEGCALVLTREFYAGHSYNSSQWVTGCLPWHDGTVVFQQVRTFTDQVVGVAGEARHFIGREMLQDKMLKSLERLRAVLEGKGRGG